MGSGIAQVAALARFEVLLHDASPDALLGAMAGVKRDLGERTGKGRLSATEATEALSRINPTREFQDLGTADLIIEAVVEDLAVKKEVFRKLDAIVAPEAILATNTSSLSVSAIASFTKTPESVVGMHFFNPAPLMKLVEIIRGSQTSDATVRRASEFAQRVKKTPVVCKDTPGFIVNRIARPFYGEALRLLGVCRGDRQDREVGRLSHGPVRVDGPDRDRCELRSDQVGLRAVLARAAVPSPPHPEKDGASRNTGEEDKKGVLHVQVKWD